MNKISRRNFIRASALSALGAAAAGALSGCSNNAASSAAASSVASSAAASEQPHGSFQQRGFPAAAFSDNSENLAGAQRKAHILYCRNSVVGNVHMVISQ